MMYFPTLSGIRIKSLLLALCAGLLPAFPAHALFSDNANAIDVLGQYDEVSLTDPNPVFTKVATQNSPNRLGISSADVGIYVDTTNHRLFLSDTGNNRILVYNMDSNNDLLDRVPDNVIGQPNFYTSTAATSQSALNAPHGLAFDPVNSRLFVSTGNRILAYDLSSGITDGMNAFRVLGQSAYTSATAGNTQTGLNVPQGLYYDTATKRLFVAESTGNRVKVFDLSSGIGNNPNAIDLLGQFDETSLTAPIPLYTKSGVGNSVNRTSLNAPRGIEIDTVHHRLFVTSTSQNRVLVYNLDSNNNLIDRVPDNVLGQLNFAANVGAITASNMQQPRGLAYDSVNDRLFVAEVANNRVTVFSTATITDGMSASYVIGQASLTTNTTATTQAGMNGTQDVLYDRVHERLFVSQSGGNRVTVYNLHSGIWNGMKASYVLGQADFTTSTAATTQAGMNSPQGLAYDAARQYLFVAQITGNRVTVYDVASITDGENAINVLGQANFTGTNAATTQAGMNSPQGLAYDAARQYLFVAQSTGNRVTVFDLASISNGENAINVLGQSIFTGTAAGITQSTMSATQAVLYDPSNTRLYVGESGNNRVTVFDVATITDGENAADVLGQTDDDLSAPGPVFTKNQTTDTPNRLGYNSPELGIALDTTNHRLFMSDTSQNRVLVYNLDSNDTLADRVPDYVLGQANFYTNSAATTQSGLSAPAGLAFDSARNYLYVAERSNNRVVVYNTSTITNGEGAIYALGQASFVSATAATTQAGMNVPQDVTYDAARQYLFVSQSTGNRVTVYNLSTISTGESAINVLGQSTFTATTAATTQAGMNVPYGLAYDPTNNYLFVAQGTGNRVTVFDVAAISDGESAIKVLGQATFTATALGNTQTGMNAPRGITYDATHQRLFVSQTTGNRVTVYELSGGITDGMNASYVFGQTLFTVITAGVTQTGLSGPSGVAYDATNNRLYILQTSGNRVGVYDMNTNFSDFQAASSILGQATFTTTTAATTQAGMNVPYDVTLSGSTTLFVSQGTGNRVTVYNIGDGITDGENAIKVLGQANFTASAAATTQAGMNAPRGMAYDSATKKLYVAQTTGNRVTAYNLANGITDGEDAVSVLGQATFTVGTAAATQAGLGTPQGIAVDSANARAYVLQNTYNRVSIFDIASITDGENAIDVLAQTDDNTASPGPVFTTTTAHNAPNIMGFSAPQGVTMDTLNHRLFVADSTNNRVLVYNLNTDNTFPDRVADYVLGQADFHSVTAVTTQASLRSPQSVEYDEATGWLFVADATNNRVLVFDLSGGISNGMNAWRVLGKSIFTSATAATTQAGMSSPQRVRYNAALQKLFVADMTNNRVLIFDLSSGITDGMDASDVLGQYDDNLSAPGPAFTKGTANNGPNKLGYSAPTLGLALDSVNHRLFMSDSANNRVLIYNLDSNNDLIDRIPDNVLGQTNFYSNTGGNTQSGMFAPQGLAYDAAGNRLFVAENTGDRVKVFYLSGGITDGMNATYILGQVSFIATTAATTQTGMSAPQDVLYDPVSKQLFVSQTGNNRVTVYDLSSNIGDNPNAVDGLGQYDEASLSAPAPEFTKSAANNAGGNRTGLNTPTLGLALDAVHHRLFVTDAGNNRILVYNMDNNNDLIDRVPDYVLGQANFFGIAAANTQSGLNVPGGLAYDPVNDRLFVAEPGGMRVKMFNLSGGITNGMNATNILGQATYITATPASTQAGMRTPQDVYYHTGDQYLYVSQSAANRVTVYDLSGGITDGMNADFVLGQTLFTTITAATTQTGMNVPYGLAYDISNDYLFVAQGTANRVTVYDVSGGITNGQAAINVLGQSVFTVGTAGTTQTNMSAPRGLAYDTTRDWLYVTETTNNRTTVYDLSGGITDGMNAAYVLGQANFTSSASSATQAGMSAANGVVLESTNNRAYIMQSGAHRVSVFDVTSISNGEDAIDVLGQTDDFSMTAPGPVFTKGAANNSPNRLGLDTPYLGVEMDPVNHRLFVADTSNNRVLVYNLSGSNLLQDRIPDYVLGQTNYYTRTTNTTQAGMNQPYGIVYNTGSSLLFVAESQNNRVLAYDLSGGITDGQNAAHVLGQATFTSATAATTQAGMNIPYGLAYDTNNDYLFVSQGLGHRVTVYDLSDGITNGEAAINVLGQANFTNTSTNSTQAGFWGPFGMDYDPANKYLFVADTGNNRVAIYDLSGGITNGMNAYRVLGQSLFTTQTAATTQAGMNIPYGVAYDSARHFVFVAQAIANRITVYDLSAGITNGQNAINVIGQSTFTTSTSANSQSGLYAPNGLLYDHENKYLYVVQSGNHRLSIFDLSLGMTNNQAASHVIGQANFTTTTAATTQAGLNAPYGLAYDVANKYLFVAQTTGNRVSVFDISAGVSDGQNAYRVLGQTDFTTTTAANTQIGLNAPRGLAYDDTADKLYVGQTTGNRVSVFNLGGGITNGQNAANVLGQAVFTTITAAITQGGLSGPQGVLIDEGNSRLYVLQNTANRISMFDVTAISDGENAEDVLGQYADDLATPIFTKGAIHDGPNLLGLNGPQGIAIDELSHRLFVSDSNNNRLLVYDLDTGNNLIDRIPDYILGQSNYYTSTAATTQTGLSSPQGVSLDRDSQRLFLSDSTNNRVLIYDLRGLSNGMAATSILGQSTYTTATALSTQAGIRGPQSVYFGPQYKKLFVAQSTNNRISIFDAEIRGISGTVYTDRGRTPIAAGKKVAVSLNGAPFAATGTTITGGHYNISGTGAGLAFTGGTVITVYLDNNSERGVTVTTGSGGSTYDSTESMSGVDIYQDTLIARTNSSSMVLTNSMIASGNSNGYADVGTIYTVDNGTLNVKEDKNLVVWSGSTFTPGGNVRIGSGLTIRGILNAGSNTIALSGSFLKEPYGTFNAGTSTVELDGLLQSVSGSTTFYNLTKTGSVTDTLTFAAGTTQTITNNLSLNGVPGGLLLLRSSVTGVQWNIDPTGSRSVSYLNVKDSNNIDATAIDCLTGCVDSLNNINWNFAGGGSSSSGSSTENSNQFFFFGF